jgi:transcriptional regulator with XRE-family HTH domain
MGRRRTSAKKARRGRRLAAELVRQRGRSSLSQSQLAERSGVSIDALRRIERKVVSEPGFFTVVDLAVTLGLPIDELADKTRG